MVFYFLIGFKNQYQRFIFDIFECILLSITPTTSPPLEAYSYYMLLRCSARSWNVWSVPPASWCACTALRSVVALFFGSLLLPKPSYILQWVPTWNSNNLGIPRSFILSWRTIPSLASHFACFLDLRVNQPYKGEKEQGASNIGNVPIFLTITSKISHRLSSRCRPFLSPFLPPQNPSTRPPPPFPIVSIVSIVTL